MTAVSSSSSELEEGELPPSPTRQHTAAANNEANSAENKKPESSTGHHESKLTRKVLANEHHRHRRRSSSHTRSYSPAQTCASGHTLPHKQQGRQPAAVLEQQAADLTASAKSSLGRLGLKEGLKCAFCHPASEPLLPYLYLACNSQQCMVNRAPEEFIDNLWRAVSTIMALAQVLQEDGKTLPRADNNAALGELGARLRTAYRSLRVVSETGAARSQLTQSPLVRKAVQLTWKSRGELFVPAHCKDVERCILDSKVLSSWIKSQSQFAEASLGTVRQADGSTVLQNGSSGSRKRQRLASADSSVVPNFISLSSKAARSVLSPSTPSRQRKSAESPSLPPAPIKDGVSFPDTPQQSPAKQQTPAALHKEDLLWSDTPQPPAAEPTSTSLEQQARRQEEKSAEADNLYEVLFTSPSSLSGSGARQPAAPGHVAVHQNGLPSPRAPVSPGPPAPPESMAGISNNDSHSNKHAGGRKYAMPYALPAGTVEPGSAPASPMDLVTNSRSRSSTPLQPPAAVDALLRQGKLCLVLDLDHTLVNSARFSEVDEQTQQKLEQRKLDQDLVPPHERELFRLDHIGMWTKLRPAVRTFLQTASLYFQLWIHTNGNRTYAQAMASLLDPHGTLFAQRIIASGAEDGSTAMNTAKRLMQGLEQLESCALVVDDTTSVWEHHKDSLLAVERYVFFPSSHQALNMPGQSFLESNRDEHGSHGQLMVAVGVLVRVHKRVYDQLNGRMSVRLPGRDPWDARAALWTERSKILAGVVILFSGLFPVGDKEPQQQRLWLQAERFGARCVAEKQEDVTHVVGKQSGTEKVHWALQQGKFVVTKAWLECSCVLWKRAVEGNFNLLPLTQTAV